MSNESPKKNPQEVGIKAFQESPDKFQEIESPMRIKKRQLGSLEIKTSATEKPTDDFKEYEAIFKVVMMNFDKKKQEFEELKKMSMKQLIEYNKEVKMQNISSDWRRQLEMHLPECKEGQHDHDSKLAEFN